MLNRLIRLPRAAAVLAANAFAWVTCWSIWGLCYACWWLARVGAPAACRWAKETAAPALGRTLLTLFVWGVGGLRVVSRETHRSENVLKRLRQGWAWTRLGATQAVQLAVGILMIAGGLLWLAITKG